MYRTKQWNLLSANRQGLVQDTKGGPQETKDGPKDKGWCKRQGVVQKKMGGL